ncbi:MAG: FMN-binding protein [Clostridia bacterium]|nr:FMN-binding protein [Clostridia bacterium]
MFNTKIKPALVLSVICIVVALLLSVINSFTAPIIEKAQGDKANAALLEVLPGASDFEALKIDGAGYPAEIIAAYKANGGFVFTAEVTGKSAGLRIMCGVDTEGKITGTKVLVTAETPSYADPIFAAVEGTDGKYQGMSSENYEEYLVSGATLTSKAYATAVKASLNAYIIANGGSVDLRTPEQILQDNLNAALGTEGIAFEKWFATAFIEGVDALYISDAGAVAVMGEKFIAVKDGAVITEAEETEKTAALAAFDAYKNESLTEIAKPEGAHKNIEKIYLASNGTYVFEVKADGYGIVGEWGGTSGEHIRLKLAIDKDGKIVSTLTTYQNETKGKGDVVATPEFYEQYNGKDAEGVKGVETVTGATDSTGGYKKAVQRAFDAFELIKGGAAQ